MIYKAYKNLGETPLECLQRIVRENNIPDTEKVTFAGRLDPAAEGEMIFLSGDDIKNKDTYIHADKTYTVEYIMGISTDTGDLLGLIRNTAIDSNHFDSNTLKEPLISLTGKRQQSFHAFSSKMVDGKPLWQHAKDGNNATAEHEITIYSIEVLSVSQIQISEIVQRVQTLTTLVNGEFRQDEINNSWARYKENKNTVPLVQVIIHCSSGSYMRVLGEELGDLLGIPVCAYSIIRNKITL